MGILDSITKQLKDNATSLARSVRHELFHKINMEITRIQKRMMKQLTSLVIVLTAIVFLAVAAVNFFIEYLLLTKTLSFLIIGILLLLIGIIIKLTK